MAGISKTGHRKVPPPLYQGDLDGLCGAYAILNAVSWLVGQRKPMRATSQGVLFAYLLNAIDEDGGTLQTLVQGLALGTILRMLQVARQLVKAEHGLEIAIHRPFLGQKKVSLTSYVAEIRQRAHFGNIAYLIGIDGRVSHWTVCVGATAQTLRLRDSNGLQRLMLATCRMRHRRKQAKSNFHLLSAKECVRLTLVD
jgi:hypothetical protein